MILRRLIFKWKIIGGGASARRDNKKKNGEKCRGSQDHLDKVTDSFEQNEKMKRNTSSFEPPQSSNLCSVACVLNPQEIYFSAHESPYFSSMTKITGSKAAKIR